MGHTVAHKIVYNSGLGCRMQKVEMCGPTSIAVMERPMYGLIQALTVVQTNVKEIICV